MSASTVPLKEIFIEALRRTDPQDRAAYLAAVCTDDAVRQRVEALLRASESQDSFLETNADPAGAPESASAATVGFSSNAPPAGSTIAGRYKLLEQIGEGGMGTVWVAEQREPVKRQVALKLVKPGMDSRSVLARFEAERQALALMDHQNIAKVLDGGVTDQGRPFFVMELVKGMPLTEYCDARRLSVRDRLDLFVQICSAVQHAHQKGIIHRDLKPSNILVTEHDGRPVPKVIDFGLAKALGAAIVLTERTIHTAFGAVVGTPLYMAPEQVAVNALDVDTRSDIYSLGVILYELLTGTTPLEKQRFKEAAWDEIRRVIREEEPPKPSLRLSDSHDSLPSISAQRHTEPAALTRLVRGELDWIVMKALEKDRNRRYETANGFSMDVQRYLAGDVVQACPPSTVYRLKKFVRRNKATVVAASLVILSLAAGVVGTTIGLLEARTARAAEAKRADGELKAKLLADEKRKEAERNLGFAKKGNEILGSVFAGLDPKKIAESGRPLQDVLRENLTRAVKELEGSAIGDPLEVAAMQNTLGMSLLALGETGLAVEVFQKALNTRKAMLGPEDQHTLVSMDNLAKGYKADGKLDLALPLLEKTLELTKAKLGPEHPGTLTIMNNLATGYGAAGKLDLALPLLEKTLELTKAKLGPEHPETLNSMFNLATGYGEARKLDLALPLLEETLKLTKAKFGHDHPETHNCMNSLGCCYWYLRRLDKSVSMFEELLALREKTLGRSHPRTLHTVVNLGMSFKDAGRVGEAIPLLEEAYTASKKHATLRWVGTQLLDSYVKAGASAKAAKLIDELLADARQAQPKESPQLAGQLAQFGLVLLDVKQYAAAEPLLRECLAIREKKEPNAWTTFNTQSMLGGSLLSQKKYTDAEPLLLKSYEGMKAREKTIPPQGATRIPEALDRLIELYTATNKPNEVKKWKAEQAKYPKPAPTPQERK